MYIQYVHGSGKKALGDFIPVVGKGIVRRWPRKGLRECTFIHVIMGNKTFHHLLYHY